MLVLAEHFALHVITPPPLLSAYAAPIYYVCLVMREYMWPSAVTFSKSHDLITYSIDPQDIVLKFLAQLCAL